MWGTPQRSRRTRTGPSSPSSSIVPFCLGSGRRASQCQAAAVAAAASPVPARPAVSPARSHSALIASYWLPSQPIAFRCACWSRLLGAPEAQMPAGRRPSASSFVEVGLHHHRRRRPQLGGDVVPGLGEQGVAGALAALEGGEQAALAHLAVLDVLGQLRRRVGDPGAVAGADQLDRLGLQRRSESM